MPNTLPGVHAERTDTDVDVADAVTRSTIQRPTPEALRNKVGLYLAMAAALFAATAGKPDVAQAQQPDSPGKPVATGGVDGGKKPPEKSPDAQRITDALLDAPDVAKLVSDLENPHYDQREAAHKELTKRVLNLLAVQNPPPAGFEKTMRAAMNPDPKDIEQSTRVGKILGMVEGVRWRDGSRFPPMKGKITEVLASMEKYTGTAIRLPVGSKAGIDQFDVLPGKNSVWDMVKAFEEKYKYGVETVSGNAIVLTDKQGTGSTIYARKGSAVLMDERKLLPDDNRELSILGEPGMCDPLMMKNAKSSDPVRVSHVSMFRLPHNHSFYHRNCMIMPGGQEDEDREYGYINREFEVDPEMHPKPKLGMTTLSVSAFAGYNRKTVSLPLTSETNASDKLGSVHDVRVQIDKDGTIDLELTGFPDVAWIPTPGTVDACLWELSRRSEISFLDADGKVLPAEMPAPITRQRTLAYVMMPPKGATHVRVTGFGEYRTIGGDFAVPTDKVTVKPKAPDPQQPNVQAAPRQPAPAPRLVPPPPVNRAMN